MDIRDIGPNPPNTILRIYGVAADLMGFPANWPTSKTSRGYNAVDRNLRELEQLVQKAKQEWKEATNG